MVTRSVLALVLVLLMMVARAAPPASSEPSGPLQIDFCDLLKDARKHDNELVTIRGTMLSNGIDALAIANPKCTPRGAIRIGDVEEPANVQNLARLFDAVQLAYRSSTSSFNVAVEVVLTGTFHVSDAPHVRPEIRPRDAESIQLVKGTSLVPAMPAPAR